MPRINQIANTYKWIVGKEMATHSNILAWRIPWTEKPGGLFWGHKELDMTQWLNKMINEKIKILALMNSQIWLVYAFIHSFNSPCNRVTDPSTKKKKKN